MVQADKSDKQEHRGGLGLSLGAMLLAIVPLPLISACVDQSAPAPQIPVGERIAGAIQTNMVQKDFSKFHSEDKVKEELIRSFEKAYSTIEVALNNSASGSMDYFSDVDPGESSPTTEIGAELCKNLESTKEDILNSIGQDSIDSYHQDLSDTVQLLQANIGLIESGDLHGSLRDGWGQSGVAYSSTQTPAFMLQGQLEFMIHLLSTN